MSVTSVRFFNFYICFVIIHNEILKTMKTILFVVALALTVSFSGNASNITSVTKNQTENITVSKSDSSSSVNTEKSKKAHGKKHGHKTSKTAKKAK